MADVPTTFDIGGGVSAGLSALQFVQSLMTGSRTAAIQIENWSSLTLYYKGARHDHGGFAVFPADRIEPGKANVFGAQNKGGSIMTGTEGWITYAGHWASFEAGGATFKPIIFFQIYWDNPYIGDPFSADGNSATVRLSGQLNSAYKARYKASSGNAAQFTFRLYDASKIPGPQIQEF